MSVFSTTNKTGFSTSLEHIAYSSADATTSDIVISPYSIVVHALAHRTYLGEAGGCLSHSMGREVFELEGEQDRK